jgi:hypothetical protein
MPQVTYPTRTRIKAPILLTAEALRRLDESLAEQLPTLRKQQEDLVPETVAERLRSSLGSLNLSEERIEEKRQQFTDEAKEELLRNTFTSLAIHFSDGSRLDAKSFSEASDHPQVSQNIATGFVLEVRCGAITATLETDYDDDLTLSVSPSNYEPARNLYSSLNRWLRSVKSPRWQQLWKTIVISSTFVWLIWIVVLFAAAGIASDLGAKASYKEQAHKLIDQGVTPDKQQKALEIILALESDYSGPAQGPLGRWFWVFLVSGTFVAAVLAYPPRLEVGIGRGEDRVVRWQKWLRFVFVIVPTFIASNFLWPVVSDLIKRFVP